ncbi:LexA family protein [Enterovibrio norvegicus]|uniref:LexA family protein n=1 Tax=Enterovibrio norvegicus TaxID=188144 RepID=UPI000C84A7F4|nr:S24 family peptidase [Enterovibrio norvegicus]PMH64508.1 hypothetical protein BCU62_15755 [Enterovibrio norvegicus]
MSTSKHRSDKDPVMASIGITGFESPASEYNTLPLSLDKLLIHSPSSTWFARVEGSSMEGVGLFDGDIAIVCRQTKVVNGDVIVVTLNGEFLVKIIDTTNRRLLSAPIYGHDNYPPLTISECDSLSHEGVVVSSIRFHRKNDSSCRR